MSKQPGSSCRGPYKLSYLQLRARGEPVRMMFALADPTKFTFIDEQIPIKDWPNFKPKTPFGQVPTLTLPDGKVYAQSFGIFNYVAKLLGFYGKTPEDGLAIDQVVGLVGDLMQCMVKAKYESDEALREANRKKLVDTEIPMYLTFFETILKANGDNGQCVGQTLTLADFVLQDITLTIEYFKPNAIESFSAIKKLCKVVTETPKLREYLAKRKHLDI